MIADWNFETFFNENGIHKNISGPGFTLMISKKNGKLLKYAVKATKGSYGVFGCGESEFDAMLDAENQVRKFEATSGC